MSWKIETLGELCFIEKGNIGINNAIPGNYPLVVTSEERKSHNEFQFDDEAVIIPLVSSTGHGHKSLKRIHYQTGKFAVGSILCAVIPKDKSILKAEYLYRFLYLNKERELVGRMKGMANVSLPIKEIAKIEIPVPPLDEQENFVESYLKLEESKSDIANEFTHQLDLIKQLRQAFLREAMQGKLTAKWRVENPVIEPASELLKRINAEKDKLLKEGKLKKDKPLPAIKDNEIPFEIPESWEWCRLGIICNYGSSPKAEPKDINDDTWVLDLEDIEKESSKIIERLTFKERKSSSTKSVFKCGQVLYSKLRPYLDKVIVADKDGVCTTEILPIEFFCDLNSYYMRYCLKRKDFLDYVNSVTKGMKMPRLGTNEGKLSIIPLSPVKEQQQIVSKLDELMKYCDDLEKSIKTSQQQNEMLLQQVLSEALRKKPIEEKV